MKIMVSRNTRSESGYPQVGYIFPKNVSKVVQFTKDVNDRALIHAAITDIFQSYYYDGEKIGFDATDGSEAIKAFNPDSASYICVNEDAQLFISTKAYYTSHVITLPTINTICYSGKWSNVPKDDISSQMLAYPNNAITDYILSQGGDLSTAKGSIIMCQHGGNDFIWFVLCTTNNNRYYIMVSEKFRDSDFPSTCTYLSTSLQTIGGFSSEDPNIYEIATEAANDVVQQTITTELVPDILNNPSFKEGVLNTAKEGAQSVVDSLTEKYVSV